MNSVSDIGYERKVHLLFIRKYLEISFNHLVFSLLPLPVDTAVPSISLNFLFKLLSLLFTDFAGSALNGFTILTQQEKIINRSKEYENKNVILKFDDYIGALQLHTY
jgi:hypothetical protein